MEFDCRNSPTNPEKWPKKRKYGPKSGNKGSETSIYPKKYLEIFRIILLDIYCRNSPQKRAKKAEKIAKKAKSRLKNLNNTLKTYFRTLKISWHDLLTKITVRRPKIAHRSSRKWAKPGGCLGLWLCEKLSHLLHTTHFPTKTQWV